MPVATPVPCQLPVIPRPFRALALLVIAAAGVCVPVAAQEALDMAPTALVLTNANVVDAVSAQPITNATVVVRDGRIDRIDQGRAARAGRGGDVARDSGTGSRSRRRGRAQRGGRGCSQHRARHVT